MAALSGEVWVATSVRDRSQLLRRDASGSWTVFDGPRASLSDWLGGVIGSASSP